MSVNLSMLAGVGAQFFDNNGIPLSGGLLYTYQAGTTVPATTYTTNLANVAQANPIVLNASGRVPSGEIWILDSQLYKFVLEDSNFVLISTYDNVSGATSALEFTNFVNNLANNTDPTKGDALIGFRQSNISGNLTNSVGSTVHQKLQEYVSVKDFGAIGDGIIDDTIALQNAFNFATDNTQSLFFPAGTYSITSTITINQNNNWNFFTGNGVATIVWNGSDTAVDMFTIVNAFFTHFIGITFKAKTNQNIFNMVSDMVNRPRSIGAPAGATFIDCLFEYGKFALRWTCIDLDANNDQGHIERCTFAHYGFCAISFEHINSLWHRILNCQFESFSNTTWAVNNVDDQNGNSFTNPANNYGFGGSGFVVENCNLVFGGWLRLNQMLYAIHLKHCFGESNCNGIYTPTNRLPFIGDTTSGSNQVTNVTNIGQLSIGDYFWNANFDSKVTITNIDVGANTITISGNAYETKVGSICDAGLPTAHRLGLFFLYIENYNGTLWQGQNIVINNQLILFNSSLANGNYPFTFSMLNCNIVTSNLLSPTFIGPVGSNTNGTIVFDNNVGELQSYSLVNGTAQLKAIVYPGRYQSTRLILSPETLLDTSSSFNTNPNALQTYVFNNILYSGQCTNQYEIAPYGTSSRSNPTGIYRYINSLTPQTINSIANMSYGATLTFYFLDGNFTLVNSTILQLKSGSNVTPVAGNKIVFYFDGTNVIEIERNF